MSSEIKLPFEYGQSAYFYELERRDQLSNRESSAYILISLIIGGLGSLLIELGEDDLSRSGAVIAASIIASIITGSAVKPLIENRFLSKKYVHAETTKVLNELCVECDSKGADKNAISNKVLEHLMMATDRNLGINDSRAQKLNWTDFRIALAITLIIVAFLASAIEKVLS